MKQVSRLILGLVALLSTFPAMAASRQVTGTVTDMQGEPLVGASVMLVNSRTGCMADIDGHFSLQVPEGPASLKVALIGYQQQTVKVSPTQTVVHIKMKEDSQTLEETVVVGYGKQKKVNLTGAVAAIEGKELEGRPVNSVSTMLQGTVAGLNVSTSSAKPGDNPSLNIRGYTSINGASPLVIIDGSIGNIDQVNPNDVQSISVIKDSSAAAIYGARAAFGVILITTKAGNEQEGKATVRYNGRFGWDESTVSTDYETSGYWHLKVMDEFQRGQNGSAIFPQYDDNDWMELLARVNDKTENPDRPWVVEEDNPGGVTSSAPLGKRWKYYGNTDWYHSLWKDKRFLTQHNVSLSGGSKNFHYFVSGAYKHNDGVAKYNNDKYNQYNLRAKIDFRINKWATFEENMSYFGKSYTYQGPGSIENTMNFSGQYAFPVFPLQNPDGSNIYGNPYFGYKVANGRHIVMMEGKHPGSDIQNAFLSTSRLNLTPIKQLTVTGDFTYRFHQNRNTKRYNNIPYREYPGADIKVYDSGAGEDYMRELYETSQYYTANAFATYKDTFKDAHNLTVVAGYNYERYNFKKNTVAVKNLENPDLNDIGLVTDLSTNVKEVGGGQQEYILQGIFGRINYDYMGKYLVELSGRYDGTSRFAKGHRWGWFPSGSIGWRFSEEKFFEGLNPWWSNGKIRFSYGSLGNQNTSDYYTFLRKISQGTVGYTFDGTTQAIYSAVGAPIAGDFTWEKANQWDLGLDLGFFNNRLNIVADIYVRDTKNMITDGAELPGVYGADPPKMNAADLRTKGYELSLDWNDSFSLFDNTFTYNVGFNISDYRTHITKFDNQDKTFAKSYYVGKEIGEIWGFVTDGLFQSDDEAKAYDAKVDQSYLTKNMYGGWQAGDVKFVDLDGDGVIGIGENKVDNPGDRKILGNSYARLQYGFRAGFSYFGFDANVFFQGTGNHYWYPNSGCVPFWGPFSFYQSITYLSEDFKDQYWTIDNPDAYFPRARGKGAALSYLQYTNDRYLQNMRYLRLKNLTVGYTFPKKWTRVAGIEKLRLYFTAENLCYWSPIKKYSKYIDPELSNYSSSTAVNWTISYPWPKTFTFGIDLQL